MKDKGRSKPSKADSSSNTSREIKLEDEIVELETKDEVNESSTGPSPSFRGSLNITDFEFKSEKSIKKESSASRRSSSRLSTPNDSTVDRKRESSSRASSSPSKRARKNSGYAPPSTYAHLPLLGDVITPNLICLFIGLNPGVETARSGHAYAHPSNLFWKLLYSSGCTTRRCSPTDDQDLPRLFELGNTNIVGRPTRNGGELSKSEMDENVAILVEKISRWKPEAVCMVGKSIWESVWRVQHGRSMKKGEFKYGWQDEEENLGSTIGANGVKSEDGGDGGVTAWKGARVFAATSTSGLAASSSPAEKERIWRELGVWVEQRRRERAAGRAEEVVS